MKRLLFIVLVNFFMLGFCVSCNPFHHRGISINISESDRYYGMYAYFDPNNTRDLEEYMNDKIGRQSNMSFINTRIDGQISLDDHTVFYIKKSPGYLRIKMDKEKNSLQSYYRLKNMCEGIKKIISK